MLHYQYLESGTVNSSRATNNYRFYFPARGDNRSGAVLLAESNPVESILRLGAFRVIFVLKSFLLLT